MITESHTEEVWRENNNSNSNKLLLPGGINCSKQIMCIISFCLHYNHIRWDYIMPILPVRHIEVKKLALRSHDL